MSLLIKNKPIVHLTLRDKYYVLFRLLRNHLCDSSSANKDLTFLENEDVSIEKEHNIEKLRNKSRLSPEHHNILFDKKPFSEPISKHHQTVKYNRRMYGIYGNESGVNPGIMWPTKVDIETRKEYEKVAYPFTIEEMISAAKKEIEMKETQIQRRHDEVVKKLAKLDIWKKELQEKIAKTEAEALAAKEKRDRLIEEVRRHFGYKVDPRDEKFKEMLVLKEKEQRKAEKKIRVEERERKAIAKLMEKHEPKETA